MHLSIAPISVELSPRIGISAEISRAREAQARWAALPLRERLVALQRLRRLIAQRASDLATASRVPNRTLAETLVGEVLPLADAIRFLGRFAPRLLAPKTHGRAGLPLWLWGVRLQTFHEPLGVVLIVGPSNYPLFLPGVQAMQALAAGNAAVIKPAPGCSSIMFALRELLAAARIDPALLGVLPESIESVAGALDAGVDKMIFTGSTDAGRAVVRMAGDRLVPIVAELSGHDAVFVCPDADLDLTAASLAFGLRFNGSATCVAPRRVFVLRSQMQTLIDRLCPLLQTQSPIAVNPTTAALVESLAQDAVQTGGRVVCGQWRDAGQFRPVLIAAPGAGAQILRQGAFAPILAVVPVDSMEQAIEINQACPFALGASIFTTADADRLARRINAGVVVINDAIAPHADPRLPFGGRGAAGMGVTRGGEGLLEMTRPKAVARRRGRWRPHFDPLSAEHVSLFLHYLTLVHAGGVLPRMKACLRLVRAAFSVHQQRQTAPASANPDQASD